MSRPALIGNITREKGSTPHLKMLLESLSTKEIYIARQNPDLLTEIDKIAKSPILELVDRIRGEFEVDIMDIDGAVWVDVKPIKHRVPEKYANSHFGWWFDKEENAEFEEWLRCFFLQEIRVNIWARYIAHKKERAANPVSAAQKLAERLTNASAEIYPGYA
jgi:hypothetical protein